MLLTLQSGDYQVSINSIGAELKSFCRKDGMEFLWNSDPKFWHQSSPLLFPTIGNVRNNKTLFLGKEYNMPKHGFCSDMDFSVVSQTDSTARFALVATDETLACYPFQFELYITYVLENQNLHISYEVCNKDSHDLPYHIGAHPGFMCPIFDGEKFEDYQLEFEKEESFTSTLYDLENLCFSSTKKQYPPAEGNTLFLSASIFDNDAIFLPHCNSRSVRLVHATTKKGVQVDYPGFHSIAFWTPIGGEAPFLCIEPWNGGAIYDDEDDDFCHKRDVEILLPGESKTYELKISLIGF